MKDIEINRSEGEMAAIVYLAMREDLKTEKKFRVIWMTVWAIILGGILKISGVL